MTKTDKRLLFGDGFQFVYTGLTSLRPSLHRVFPSRAAAPQLSETPMSIELEFVSVAFFCSLLGGASTHDVRNL
jgi:hypothetical protein